MMAPCSESWFIKLSHWSKKLSNTNIFNVNCGLGLDLGPLVMRPRPNGPRPRPCNFRLDHHSPYPIIFPLYLVLTFFRSRIRDSRFYYCWNYCYITHSFQGKLSIATLSQPPSLSTWSSSIGYQLYSCYSCSLSNSLIHSYFTCSSISIVAQNWPTHSLKSYLNPVQNIIWQTLL